MIRPGVLALVSLLGLLDSAQAGFIKINVGAPTTVETDLPTSINAGQSFQFDLLLVGAENLWQYGFVLTLSSGDDSDVAGLGNAFYITASNESSTGNNNPRYVFGGDSFDGTPSSTITANKVEVTLGDFLLTSSGVTTVAGVNDLLTTFTVTTSSALKGNLQLSVSTDENLFFDTPPNMETGITSPINNFTSVSTSLRTYDVNAGGAPLVVTNNGSLVNPVPEPSSVTLGLVGLATILCGRRFARRLMALPNG